MLDKWSRIGLPATLACYALDIIATGFLFFAVEPLMATQDSFPTHSEEKYQMILLGFGIPGFVIALFVSLSAFFSAAIAHSRAKNPQGRFAPASTLQEEAGDPEAGNDAEHGIFRGPRFSATPKGKGSPSVDRSPGTSDWLGKAFGSGSRRSPGSARKSPAADANEGHAGSGAGSGSSV